MNEHLEITSRTSHQMPLNMNNNAPIRPTNALLFFNEHFLSSAFPYTFFQRKNTVTINTHIRTNCIPFRVPLTASIRSRWFFPCDTEVTSTLKSALMMTKMSWYFFCACVCLCAPIRDVHIRSSLIQYNFYFLFAHELETSNSMLIARSQTTCGGRTLHAQQNATQKAQTCGKTCAHLLRPNTHLLIRIRSNAPSTW